MRILYLALDVNLSDVTGDAIHVLEATRALAAAGAKVDLVVPKIQGEEQDVPELERAGVWVHSVDTSGNVSNSLACRKIAQRSGCEIIYERRESPKIGAAVSQTTGLPFIIEINGIPDIEQEAMGVTVSGSGVRGAVKGAVRKRLFRRASRVVAVTPWIANELQNRYGLPSDRVEVVSNGADTDRFRPMDASDSKRQLGILPRRQVVVFVGTLRRWYGLQYLIGAMEGVLARAPDTLALIVGDGPERSKLEDLVGRLDVHSHVQFAGRVDHELVPRYMAAADIYERLERFKDHTDPPPPLAEVVETLRTSARKRSGAM